MNLLRDAWMPVRDHGGERHWITPDRVSEPQWLAFDAARPDFNGALAQFAIGLLQTTTPVQDSIEWRGLFNAPPDAAALRGWFEPVAGAFEFDGGGPRFMQDLNLGEQGVATNDIRALLIEAPGENTTKNNTDLFVKRSEGGGLCPSCAALALLALQLNAPSGGAGHRTGLRGGGPLTTLVLGPSGSHLWHDLWLNVRDRPAFLAQAGNPDETSPAATFPWLRAIDTVMKATGQVAPVQVHPAHVFWAMPRRIRLGFSACIAGSCSGCGRSSERLLTSYRTKNYGLNYKGAWDHPLSPYYEGKEGWLPLHPQPDGLGYRHWLAWVLGTSDAKKSQRSARVVERALTLSHRQTGGQLRLRAFGYDMDNMKARCWYESTLPLYALADCDAGAKQHVQSEVARWLAGAELTAMYLRGAVKDAWFDGDARGDFGGVDAAFWSATEPDFYAGLHRLIDAARGGGAYAELEQRSSWHATISRTARRLFDDAFAGTGPIERQNPRRVALAHRQLRRNLGGPKLRAALGLPDETPNDSASRRSAKTKPKEA